MESHRPIKRAANGMAEETEDRLSALPDDLLHCILREVPLKYAVRTSVLSRRWPRLWRGALAASPVLDFSDNDFARRQPPAQAAATMRRCLRLHAKRGAPLDVFRVSFRSPAGGFREDVIAWVAAAVARGARDVGVDLTPTRWRRAIGDEWDLDVDGSAFLELPANLFQAKSSLALVRCSLRAVPPSAAGLAGLRSLSLSHVDVTDEALRDVLANLHSLEFLSLRSCNLLFYVKIAGEKLRRLEFVGCPAVRELRATVPELESFAFHRDMFYFGTCESIAINLGATPALRDAYLSHLGCGYYDAEQIYFAVFAYCAYLSDLAHATVLTICSVGLQHVDATRDSALTMDIRELQYQLRWLNNVRIDSNRELRLDLPNLQELQLLMSSLAADDVDRIAGFFQFTRPSILERFIIHLHAGGKSSRVTGRLAEAALAGEDENDTAADIASNSDLVLNRLKLIKVVNFRGTRCEVQLLRFLMNRAPALEQLVLVTVEGEGTLGEEDMKIVQGRVMAMRTASADATVTVCRPSEDISRNPVHVRFYHEE